MNYSAVCHWSQLRASIIHDFYCGGHFIWIFLQFVKAVNCLFNTVALFLGVLQFVFCAHDEIIEFTDVHLDHVKIGEESQNFCSGFRTGHCLDVV